LSGGARVYLALAVVNVVMVLSPERVVIGGGVMRQAHLLPTVRAETARLLGGYVRARAIETIETFVVSPSLGDRAGVFGGFALAQRTVPSG
jgi:fructokinase